MEDLTSKQYQDIGEAVGMPDATDKANIRQIILKYEKEHPGEITFHRNAAREHMGTHKNEFAEMSVVTGEKNSNRRYLFELPPELFKRLETYIPTLFRSKKHFAWFCKNFKELMIPGKY